MITRLLAKQFNVSAPPTALHNETIGTFNISESSIMLTGLSHFTEYQISVATYVIKLNSLTHFSYTPVRT